MFITRTTFILVVFGHHRIDFFVFVEKLPSYIVISKVFGLQFRMEPYTEKICRQNERTMYDEATGDWGALCLA